MTLPTGVEIDDECVRFSGRSGRLLLLSLLKRAKFAEPFAPEALLNPWIASLVAQLTASVVPEAELQDFGDDPRIRHEIEQLIASDAESSGWWRMTGAEKADYLQAVVAAPFRMSDVVVEEIIFGVDNVLWNARKLVSIADNLA